MNQETLRYFMFEDQTKISLGRGLSATAALTLQL